MSMRKMNCCSAGCNNCLEGICVKDDPWEMNRKYICSSYPKKHKKVDADKCGNFKCNDPSYLYCHDCPGCK